MTVKESDILKGVSTLLRIYGWMVQRNQQGLGATRGRPDLEAYKDGVALFIECKAPRGRLSAWQQAYLAKLESCGMRTIVANDLEAFQQEVEQLESIWGNSPRLFNQKGK